MNRKAKKATVRGVILGTKNVSPRLILKILAAYDKSLSADVIYELSKEFVGGELPSQPEPKLEHFQANDQIDSLYEELALLLEKVDNEPELEPIIERGLTRLRSLQEQEAVKLKNCFENGRILKPGSGYQAIEHAEKLIAHED